MLRASACHNYSPKPSDDASGGMEPPIPALIMADSQRIPRRTWRFSADPRRVALKGDAVSERPLDGAGHRAAPSTARCRPRGFAHANYLGLNLREVAGGMRVDPDNDVENPCTYGGREVTWPRPGVAAPASRPRRARPAGDEGCRGEAARAGHSYVDHRGTTSRPPQDYGHSGARDFAKWRAAPGGWALTRAACGCRRGGGCCAPRTGPLPRSVRAGRGVGARRPRP